MLQLLNYIFRGLGVVCFLLTCYLWYFTSNLPFFLIAKRLTIIFFGLSLLLWLIGIFAPRFSSNDEE
jgi:hypothetical protein